MAADGKTAATPRGPACGRCRNATPTGRQGSAAKPCGV